MRNLSLHSRYNFPENSRELKNIPGNFREPKFPGIHGRQPYFTVLENQFLPY